MPARRARTRAPRSNPAEVPRISKLVHTQNASGSQRREVHFERASSGSQRQSAGNSGTSPVQGYRQTKRSLGEVSGATPKLAAEWLVCVLVIAATQLTKDNDYLSNMSETLWRVTATTGVFFVLALASMDKRLSGLTVAFGGLILVTIIYKNTDEIKTVFDVASGKGSGQTTATLDADIDPSASAKVGHEFVQ